MKAVYLKAVFWHSGRIVVVLDIFQGIYLFMSVSKLNKYIERPFELESVEYTPILVSDSKGNCLSRQFQRENFNFHVKFICRGGATFPQQYYFVERQIRSLTREKCVFFVFLGTCDLTAKNNRCIDLKTKDETSVHQIFHYIDKFNKLVNAYGSRVVFLEVPPYSIQNWNLIKGQRSSPEFVGQDKILRHRIALVNEYIGQVNFANSVSSPNFKSAVVRSHNSKRGRRYSTNYNLYSDGVHPTPLLARHWLRSFLTAVKTYC